MTKGNKYHINPKTGNPNKCNANYNCPFDDMEYKHYSTKEKAREYYEMQMNSEFKDPSLIIKDLSERFPNENPDLDFDIISFNIEKILESDKAWSTSEKYNLQIVNRIDKIIKDGDDFNIEEIEQLFRHLKFVESKTLDRNNSWKTRDNNIADLSKNIFLREYFKRKSEEENFTPPKRENNKGIIGLEETRLKFINDFNKDNEWKGKLPINKDSLKYFENSIDRVVSGEEFDSKLPEILKPEANYESLYPSKERIFNLLSKDNEDRYNAQVYLATVFPDNELKQAFERSNLSGVSVSNFVNGREYGLVYTVLDPEGNTRSFSVYEHRNTDSIIINGKTNWNSEELPYSTDSSHGFFAEFSYNDQKAAADALTYYLKSSQNGTLQNDQYLVDTADKIDWNAILSKQIPGFKKWVEKVENSEIDKKLEENGLKKDGNFSDRPDWLD